MAKEAILRRPDTLEEMADRLRRAETSARHALTEISKLKKLYRRLSPEAETIASQVWKR